MKPWLLFSGLMFGAPFELDDLRNLRRQGEEGVLNRFELLGRRAILEFEQDDVPHHAQSRILGPRRIAAQDRHGKNTRGRRGRNTSDKESSHHILLTRTG